MSSDTSASDRPSIQIRRALIEAERVITEADNAPTREKAGETITRAVTGGLLTRIRNSLGVPGPSDEWWCPYCARYLAPQEVTVDECHDESQGGCGCAVVDGQYGE